MNQIGHSRAVLVAFLAVATLTAGCDAATYQTSTPYAASTPVPTNAPTGSQAPAATQAPVPTRAAAATQAPVPIKARAATQAPVPTKAPAATQAPVPTRVAAGRQAPAISHAIPPAALRGHHDRGRGGSRTGSVAAGGLPADWPADLPLPRGRIIGSTASAGRWTVLILAVGPAADVRRSTAALYSSAGFTAVSDSVLNKGNRQITLVVENRDHSATETNLVIGVTTQ
jgi:hypothetical protein